MAPRLRQAGDRDDNRGARRWRWRRPLSRARLFERCRAGNAHAEVAREEQTTRYQVSRAFEVGADELQARRERRPPRRLSLDEAAHRRRGELATVISDLDRRRVIEVLDGRSRHIVERYLQELPESWRRSIEIVSIDPYEATGKRSMLSYPRRGSWSTTSTWSAAPTRRSTQFVANASENAAPAARKAPGAAAST